MPYTFKVHCRNIETRKLTAVYVEIPENNEKMAMVEAEKDGKLKARKAYFAGVKSEKAKKSKAERVDE